MLASLVKRFIKKIIYGHKSSSQSYISHLRSKGCEIGEGTIIYGPWTSVIDESSLQYIEIGSNVQITPRVTILGHDYSFSVFSSVYKDLPRVQKKTIVGNNVFIGMNSTILMGSRIGDNVIIGAGSVVSGRVESNCVYGGNPAKRICSLDEYYEKCCELFEESAKIYVEGFVNRYGRCPKIDENELAAYKTLFKNDISSFKPNDGIDIKHINDINENMKKRAKYDSVEQLLNS